MLIIAVATCFAGCSIGREQTTAPSLKADDIPAEVSAREQLLSTALLIDASNEMVLGNLSRAHALFREALEKDPRNDAALYELARLQAMEGLYDEALNHMLLASRISPDNIHYQLTLADIYILTDDLSKAIRVYEAISASNPEKLGLHQNLVNAYLQNKQYDQAIERLEMIENLVGFSPEINIKKQQIFVSQGKFQEAIGELKAMIGSFPEELMFYELLGELYLETAQEEKAREVYETMLEKDPESHMAHLLLADYYHTKGEDGVAFDHLKEAFRSPLMQLDGKARIIYTYMHGGDQSAQQLERGTKLSTLLMEAHPDDPEAFFIHGDMLNSTGKLYDARKHYLDGLALDPSNLSAWQQVLSIDLQLEDFASMQYHAERAMDYFFGQPILFLFSGLANIQLENYARAAAALEDGLSYVVSDDEMKQDFFSMLGDTYHNLGKHEQSDASYEKSLELNPRHPTTLNNYSYHLAVRGERLEEALKMAEKANTLEPGQSAFQDTYGWIKYRLGDFEAAEVWIRKALDSSEEPGAVILEHYGDVMYQLGDKEAAFKYWNKARETGKGSGFLDKKIRDRTLYE